MRFEWDGTMKDHYAFSKACAEFEVFDSEEGRIPRSSAAGLFIDRSKEGGRALDL